tara:strand:+ start:891 stop:1445 length:555 start_codon:yes stop_codon:yes gene_type:complete
MFTIVEDFYADPDSVRDYALSQNFNVSGNYPGLRTASCTNDGGYADSMQSSLGKIIGKTITHFPLDGYNTSFQYTTEESTTWIHHDAMSYAAVIYLTPNAPLDSGTAIYKHRQTGLSRHSPDAVLDFNEFQLVEDDWDIVGEAKNVYNRLVIYDAMYYHRSVVPGFGTDKFDGRLFQTFFFEAE